jgi:hypothetical protein
MKEQLDALETKLKVRESFVRVYYTSNTSYTST